MTPSAVTRLTTLAAEDVASSISPYAVGGIILGILLALMAALIAFGAGREHS